MGQAASMPRKPSRWRQVKWRGVVSVVGFFALWHLAVVMKFAGFAELPTPIQTLDTFFSRFFANQFKRNCVPDGPKVGSVSLSPRGDWRMPSDADSGEF